VNRLDRIFKAAPREVREFPAMAVFFRHEGDAFLFDTGYSARALEYGWRSRAYNLLNPVVFREQDSLKVQLAADGISPKDIKGVILSHLHPDHIGGLLDFPGSEAIVSKGSYQTWHRPKLLDLVFMNLLPQDFKTRVRVLDFEGNCDFFGDNSLLLKDISGHTNGQLGLYLPESKTFFAADSCWGTGFLEKEMRAFPKLLQKDYAVYQETQRLIRQMQADGIHVVYSHEVPE
jgi:glyoxylase-like metal-dependent hydrolase (beta-lactamase superfamily II)